MAGIGVCQSDAAGGLFVLDWKIHPNRDRQGAEMFTGPRWCINHMFRSLTVAVRMDHLLRDISWYLNFKPAGATLLFAKL